jgi:putative inorganic carbon (hco3(-)) transporter
MHLLKWLTVLLFTQCFLYKGTGFGLSWELGLTVTPDRLVFIIIFLLAIWSLTYGELQLPSLKNGGGSMLLFTLICTVSNLMTGSGSDVLFYLFDFNYNPFVIFLIAKSLPHSRKKLESLSFAFLAVGTYLVINAIFEHFGPHALVWPQYILDPEIGIQYGRTRGSFVSSEALGGALVVTFLFYDFYTTYVKGIKLYWAYFMLPVTAAAIYATTQRSVWMSWGLCLGILAIMKTKMRRDIRLILAVIILAFFSGVGNHFSFWADQTLFSKRQQTVNYRLVNNLTTLSMGMANPIFGVGYGNFKIKWQNYFYPIADDVPDLTDGNHNTFLGLFAEVGLVGSIPYLLTVYYMFQVGLRVYRKSEGFERDFSLIFLLVTMSYIIGGNFSDYRHGQFCNTALFLLFGTIARMDMQLAFSTQQSREGNRGGQMRIERGIAAAKHHAEPLSKWKLRGDTQATHFTSLPL